MAKLVTTKWERRELYDEVVQESMDWVDMPIDLIRLKVSALHRTLVGDMSHSDCVRLLFLARMRRMF